MAGKVYKRQILLHSNSSEETEKLDIVVKTAEIPIRQEKLPYSELGVVFFTTSCMVLLMNNKFDQDKSVGILFLQMFFTITILLVLLVLIISAISNIFDEPQKIKKNRSLIEVSVFLTISSGFFTPLFFLSVFIYTLNLNIFHLFSCRHN